MANNLATPAAQYLRMSTEHQQYSLDNQSAAIQRYAEAHGFVVAQTYSDAARSGVVLTRRPGLQRLLKDVVSGTGQYQAVLVYDVSRWGRFQDADEAAHYEFLCKSAGIPVHYCAETFANDGTLPSLIMKALKRTMAGEFSRELGVKVLDGQKRLARLGFKQGGVPGYGLRRMLVSSDGKPKQQLSPGERKSIATDRVILVPGPPAEVQVVREIFRMLTAEKCTVYAIARRLNQNGIKYIGDAQWDYLAVHHILTHPKYSGCHAFGRTSQRLCTPVVRLPQAEWTLTPGAFEAIVDHATFDRAQQVLHERTVEKSNEELLDELRSLLVEEGRLSLAIINKAAAVPSASTYRHRFGSLQSAYALIGYGHPSDFGPIDLRRRTQALRDDLMVSLQTMFPSHVSIMRRGGRSRSRLRLRNNLTVAVIVARSVRTWTNAVRWRVNPTKHERGFVTLLARLNMSNDAFKDFYFLPGMDRRRRFDISDKDSWLNRGERLANLSKFCEVLDRICVLPKTV